MHEFNQSLRYDRRMYAQDIRGSIAYAKALTLTGLLTKDEEKKLVDGLTAVGKEWENGQVILGARKIFETRAEQDSVVQARTGR